MEPADRLQLDLEGPLLVDTRERHRSRLEVPIEPGPNRVADSERAGLLRDEEPETPALVRRGLGVRFRAHREDAVECRGVERALRAEREASTNALPARGDAPLGERTPVRRGAHPAFDPSPRDGHRELAVLREPHERRRPIEKTSAW